MPLPTDVGLGQGASATCNIHRSASLGNSCMHLLYKSFHTFVSFSSDLRSAVN
jgi:hypothetical protein